jgi:4-hydroxy-3-polyprenylbenzoate decarboxylase
LQCQFDTNKINSLAEKAGSPGGAAGVCFQRRSQRRPSSTSKVEVMSRKPAESRKPRIVVGISGASGAVYGVRLLELLKACDVETHLIISRAAQVTLAYETDLKVSDLERLASVVHPNNDIGAACSSGSFKTLGMIIAPCSIKTMSEITTGNTGNLISRSADVVLKERRRLVLLLRETPLHIGHIRTMAAVTEAGAIVYPPVPAFYAMPKTLADMVDHTIGRVLDLFDIDVGTVRRWSGDKARPKTPKK